MTSGRLSGRRSAPRVEEEGVAAGVVPCLGVVLGEFAVSIGPRGSSPRPGVDRWRFERVELWIPEAPLLGGVILPGDAVVHLILGPSALHGPVFEREVGLALPFVDVHLAPSVMVRLGSFAVDVARPGLPFDILGGEAGVGIWVPEDSPRATVIPEQWRAADDPLRWPLHRSRCGRVPRMDLPGRRRPSGLGLGPQRRSSSW